MNKVVVKIQNDKGKWCTWNNVAIPVKYGKLLDEQLDYAQVSLMRIKKARFAPLTRAQLIITDKYNDTETLDYFVADDDCYENPVGSGCYEHTLTLIEPTKWLECFPLETLTFTNNFLSNVERIPPEIVKGQMDNTYGDIIYKIPTAFLTPVYFKEFSLPNLKDFLQSAVEFNDIFDGWVAEDWEGKIFPKIILSYERGTKVWEKEYNYNKDGTPLDSFSLIDVPVNANYLNVRVLFAWKTNANAYSDYITDISFTVGVRLTSKQLVPWTVDSVIQRVLQCVEPLRKGQTPRFKFDKSTLPEDKQALFDKIAPEFTFTRTTLREALQQIGGFIHAEPRLNLATMSIEWDFYGEEETAQITTNKGVIPLKDYKYRTLQRKRNLDETANALDSYQDNLINRLNWADATTATPFDGGFQTLRMDTAWARGEQGDSWHIETAENIDRIVKVEMQYNGNTRDITKYVFDKKTYDNLSALTTVYPTSKSYALYYTRGGKGIYGLFFKNDEAFVPESYIEYAIVNIYNKAFNKFEDSLNYEKMQFRVTYVPIYSTRVQQCKQTLQDFLPLPRTVNYTQSDNSVETQYFGENIKGAIARMGNAEKNVTMDFRSLYNIPKAGQLFDDEYYISEVSTAVSSDIFQVTLGLSKNFNRKSKYIGASSIKRLYEVSEEQVQERHTVLQDYIVVSDTKQEIAFPDEHGYLYTRGFLGVAYMFDGSKEKDYFSVKSVLAYGTTYQNQKQEQVLLPVIASAFGNSMSFTWRYKDNFSAGYQALFAKKDKVSGYFTVETEYADYFGRLYYYNFKLYTTPVMEMEAHNANDLPYQADFVNYGNVYVAGVLDDVYALVLRKDSRETLKFTYNINFVTDDNSYVLGAGLTEKNPLVQDLDFDKLGVNARPTLYVLPRKLNRFERIVDLSGATAIAVGSVVADVGKQTIYVNGNTSTVSGKSWAYVFPEYTDTETEFEDEYGNIVKLQSKLGGELVVGKNIDITAGDTVGAFMMQAVHDIYKYYEEMKKLN